MRHIPFIKALAEVVDTSDPVWQDASAGYLVLRFFDRWLDDGPALMSFDQTLPKLKARLESGEEVNPQVGAILLSAVQTMIDAPGTDPASVTGPLQAYGKYLETAGRRELAAHVYHTIIEALDPPSGCVDAIAAATVLMQYGYVTRLLGDFPASNDAYLRAETLGQEANVPAIALRARVGIANTLRARGNLGEAESLLTRVIDEAARAGILNAESWALHSRGAIRVLRDQHVDAVLDFFRAYKLTGDAAEREFILADLGATAARAGYLNLAFDTNRILAYTANNPLIRSGALGNLLELTVVANDAREFKRIRAQIQIHAQRHDVPIEHEIYIALHTAYGIERFDTRAQAIDAYCTVITQAQQHGLQQVAFEAEQRLAALLDEVVVPLAFPIQEPPDVLRSVVETVAEWGSLVAAAE